ncbi:Solute carrier family 25 member 45 [Balamuthia mandrillaris]
MAGVCAGHPFDTVKVRLQAQYGAQRLLYAGLGECVRSTWRAEGLVGFYKGMLTPMLGSSVVASVLFGSFSITTRAVSGFDDVNLLSLPQIFLAGGLCSFFVSNFNTPIDLVKSRLQIQRRIAASSSIHGGGGVWYNGPWHCVKHTLKTEGVTGLWRGWTATVLRDCFSLSMYLGSYHWMRRTFGQSTNSVFSNMIVQLCIGGVAGCLGWATAYPLDVVKTRLQTQQSQRYSGIYDCALQTLNRGGLKEFYRGLTPTLLRAFPVNAVMLLAYELGSQLIQEQL